MLRFDVGSDILALVHPGGDYQTEMLMVFKKKSFFSHLASMLRLENVLNASVGVPGGTGNRLLT